MDSMDLDIDMDVDADIQLVADEPIAPQPAAEDPVSNPRALRCSDSASQTPPPFVERLLTRPRASG